MVCPACVPRCSWLLLAAQVSAASVQACEELMPFLSWDLPASQEVLWVWSRGTNFIMVSVIVSPEPPWKAAALCGYVSAVCLLLCVPMKGG